MKSIVRWRETGGMAEITGKDVTGSGEVEVV